MNELKNNEEQDLELEDLILDLDAEELLIVSGGMTRWDNVC